MSGASPWECKCGARFVGIAEANRHAMQHKGQKPVHFVKQSIATEEPEK